MELQNIPAEGEKPDILERQRMKTHNHPRGWNGEQRLVSTSEESVGGVRAEEAVK